MLRIVVSGDRNWSDIQRVRQCFSRFDNHQGQVELIHGDCKGLDKMAGYVGNEKGWTVIPVPAEWNKFGPSAGPIRNSQMLDMNPSGLIWFHDDIQNSRGTKDMIKQAESRGIKVFCGSS